jgi:Phage-related minor tail protein
MVEQLATIRLKAIDENVVATIGSVNTKFTSLTIASTLLAGGLNLTEKAANSSFATYTLGAKNADAFAKSIAKVSDANSMALKSFSALSDVTFISQQVAIAISAVGQAADKLTRIPQTLDAISALGVSTKPIEDFRLLKQAVFEGGESVSNFVTSSIAELGRFEAAAARAGTILRSSTRVDSFGNAERANAAERLENALSVQQIVSGELKNSVTSTEALLGQYEVLSSGFTDSADSQKILAAGSKLIGIAKAGGNAADPAATLQLLTKTLNAYNLSAEDAQSTAATINAIVENGLTTVQELSNGLGATSKTASSAGISLKEVAAATALLTVQGVPTAEAFTGIERIASNIITKTPEAEKELQKIGVRFGKAEIESKGFTQSLIDLYEAADGNSEIIAKIFPEAVSFRTVNSLLSESGARLKQFQSSIDNTSIKSLDDVFEIATSDRVSRFEQTVNRFRELIIQVAIEIAPIIEPGLSALEKIAEAFIALPAPVKSAIGEFIKWRVILSSGIDAAGILAKALIAIGTNYLVVRLSSLALTGQLGKEIGIVRDLIAQKKGLLAVSLQLLGLDQRALLATTGATAATRERAKATTLLGKATAAVGNTAASVVGKFGSSSSDVVRENLENIKQQAVATGKATAQSVKNIAKGVAEVAFPDERPLTLSERLKDSRSSATGVDRITQEAKSVVDTIVGGKPRIEGGKPSEKEDIKQEKELEKSPDQILEGLAAKEKNAAKARSIASKDIDERDRLGAQLDRRTKLVESATRELEERQKKLELVKSQALDLFSAPDATDSEKSAKIKDLSEAEARVKTANNSLSEREFQLRDTNTKYIIAENRAKVSSIALDEATAAAKVKLVPLSNALVAADVAQANAKKLAEAAIVANTRAELLENQVGASSAAIIEAKNAAIVANTNAQNAATIASTRRATADRLYTQNLLASELAEKGLARARIFNRDLTYATTGVVGGLNKVLAASVGVTQAASGSKLGLASSIGFLTAAISLENILLKAQEAAFIGNIALGKTKGAITGLGNIAKGAAGAIGQLLAPIGLAAPLLIAGAGAAVLFREEIFGVGAEARKLSAEFAKFASLQEKLKQKYFRQVTVNRFLSETARGEFSNLLGGELSSLDAKTQKQTRNAIEQTRAAQVEAKEATSVLKKEVTSIGSAKPIQSFIEKIDTASTGELKLELKSLTTQGIITEDQQKRLAESIDRVGQKSENAKNALADLRAELDKLGDKKPLEVEGGIFDKIGGFFGSILPATGKAIDEGAATVSALARSGVDLATTPLSKNSRDRLGRGGSAYLEEAKVSREADRYLKSLNELASINSESNTIYSESSQNARVYADKLALIPELQEKIARGEKLTKNDLAADESEFNSRRERTQAFIKKSEQDIANYEQLLANAKTKEQKQINQSAIDSTRAALEAAKGADEKEKINRENTIKYLNETLPATIKGLKENSDVGLLLKNSEKAFAQQFVEVDGKATKFIKTLEQLKNEADNYAQVVIQALEAGELDKSGAETEAAKKLREIRNSKITYLENGVEKTAFKLNLQERKQYTQQILELEKADIVRAEKRSSFIANSLKFNQQNQLEIAENTNFKLAQIEEKNLSDKVARKEKEIAEYKSVGLRTIDLQLELEELQQALSNSATTRRIAAFKQEIAAKNLIAQQQTAQISKYIGNLQIEQNKLSNKSSITTLLQKQLEFDFSNKLKDSNIDEVGTLRISNLEKTQKLEKEIFIIQSSQNYLAAGKAANEAKSRAVNALQELDNLIQERALLVNEGASNDALSAFDLKLVAAKTSNELAQSELKSAIDNLEIQKATTRLEAKQLEQKQKYAEIGQRIDLQLAENARLQQSITAEAQKQTVVYEAVGKALDLQKSALNSNLEAKQSVGSFIEGELSLAAKLSDNEKEKLDIARAIATSKLNSLQQQIQLEARVLEFNQQQQLLQLEIEKSKNESASSSAEIEVRKADLALQKAKTTGASPEDIAGAEFDLRSKLLDRAEVQLEKGFIERRAQLQDNLQAAEINNFQRGARLKYDSARTEAIEALPLGERKAIATSLKDEFIENARRIGADFNSDLYNRISNNFLNLRVNTPSVDRVYGDQLSRLQEFNEGNTTQQNKTTTVEKVSLENVQININLDKKDEVANTIESEVFKVVTGIVEGIEKRF